MDLSAVISQCRAAADRLLTDRVHILGEGTQEEDEWGTIISHPRVLFENQKALVQMQANRVRSSGAAPSGQSFSADPYAMKLPVGVDVPVGSVVQVLSSLDPHLVRRRFRVMSSPAQSWSIQRRLDLDPMSPEEDVWAMI